MDSSLWSAGQSTHLKIVVVALIASIAVVVIGLNGRLDGGGTTERTETADVTIKAGMPKAYTDIGQANIR
jgi:hypothetical protein